MLNNTKDILTLKDLQELLHIGKNTALRLVQSGEIKAFRESMENFERKRGEVYSKIHELFITLIFQFQSNPIYIKPLFDISRYY